MTPRTTAAFALPDRLSAKSTADLVAADEAHFALVRATVATAVEDLSARLDEARRAPGGRWQAALERDQEVRRLGARLRTLRRFDRDLCLGRMVGVDGEIVYVGRLGLADEAGRRLLVDWRSPAAEPFFGATHAHPMGLASRRRYRWTDGRVTDYWDEVFTAEGRSGHAALDEQSAFIASLGEARSPRMRDVLATIQADQDAAIRAGSAGTLVVDGGPGTGKTVVALHRAAYLTYADPRIGSGRGGVLFVGPHRPYLAYVADVLPSLGEDGVQTCTLADLVPEDADAVEEADPEVARLKSAPEPARAWVEAVDRAVGIYEEPPSEGQEAATPWGDVWVGTADWAEAFTAADPGTPHNEARDQVWEALLDILVDKLAETTEEAGVSEEAVRAALVRSPGLAATLNRAWPMLEPAELVADLWAVPAYLRACAPWLSPAEVATLRRPEGAAWTDVDLPILDAARLRLGDPEASRRRHRQQAAVAAEREERAAVVDHLIASDDSEMMVMSMLRGADLSGALEDPSSLPPADTDRLAGPFAHVVVDEAQELTDAQWQMLLARCPSRSLTVVGDRAQARHGFTATWEERLGRAGLDRVAIATLSVNYRTPEEVMAEAAPVIRSVLPDANVPTSVRRSGVPVTHGALADLDRVLDDWLVDHPDGTACVIGAPAVVPRARVRSLTPALAKGLEFDLVVLVEPATFGDGFEGAVDRYVAMTRATQRLVVLGN